MQKSESRAKLVKIFAVAVAASGWPGLAAEPSTQPGGDPFLTRELPATLPSIEGNDLIRYEIKEGMLIPTTRIQPTETQNYTLAGSGIPVSVTVMQRGPAVGRYTPDSLQVVATEQTVNVMLRTTLFSVAGQFNLARDLVTPGQEMTIQLVQSPMAAGTGQAVALHLQKIGPANAGERQTYAADNFVSFIRNYPLETARYVRPMVEMFSPQPHLFVVSDELAWTVFPEAFPIAAEKRQQIVDLVKQLNADDYPRRQKASEALQEMGVPAAIVLAGLDRSTLAPEQAARVEGILARVKPAAGGKPEQLRGDVSFLLDCMMSPNRALRAAGLDQLRKLAGAGVEYAMDAEEEQRVKAVYQLRKKLLADGPTTVPAKQDQREGDSPR